MKNTNLSPTPSIYGLDLTKQPSELMEGLRNKLMCVRGEMSDIINAFPVTEIDMKHLCGLLSCGLEVLYRAKKEALEREIKKDDKERGKSLYFSSRGLGSDWGTCFICEESEKILRTNIAAFVKSKEEGETILSWFNGKARLDFRPSEPNWIQMKVCACEKHIHNLEYLSEQTSRYHIIRKKDVEDAVNYKEPDNAKVTEI